MTIGILVPVLASGYHAEVMSGIGGYLLEKGYFYLIAHHRHRSDLIDQYPRMLTSRGAEGIIAVDTGLEQQLSVPVVAVAGHRKLQDVTNVVLDHMAAAEMTLRHLYDLGHRDIAFMRGQEYSADSATRWKALVKAARDLGLKIRDELTVVLTEDLTSPQLGYPVARQLLERRRDFTALVCFNDVAAIGAIRALHDARMRVPRDISVVGFDDIPQSAFHTPSLTTVRQPLHEMGRLAAQCLLNRLSASGPAVAEVRVSPELVVRESTGRLTEPGKRGPR
jgi:LacI family transcriptional regulator